MPIEISVKPGIVENIHIGVTFSLDEIKLYTSIFQEFQDVFAWYYEEIPSANLSIVVHEIPTYPNAKLVHQQLRPMHPRKETTIREKLKNF